MDRDLAGIVCPETRMVRRRAVVETHPAHLATIAGLLGFRAPEVARCRVLELGCGDGGNLLPLAAAMPEATFLGLDRSAGAIELGCALLDDVDLPNLALRHLDQALLEADAIADCSFDYIIIGDDLARLRGETTDSVLRFCQRVLGPDGLIFAAYSALPGCSMSRIVGELARYAGSGAGASHSRVERARATLRLVAEELPGSRTAYTRQFRGEASRLLSIDGDDAGDPFLAPFHPLYYHEVQAAAACAGLRQVADARLGCWASAQPSELRQVIEYASDDLAGREQLLDFLRNRRFRRSILAHAGPQQPADPCLASLSRLRVRAAVLPVCVPIDVAVPRPEAFRTTRDGSTRSVSFSYLKAILAALAARWPASSSVADVIAHSRGLLRGSNLLVPPQDSDAWASLIIQACAAGLIELFVWEPAIAPAAGPRPRATDLSRLQARRGLPVVNLRHQEIRLGPEERCLLGLLAGAADRDALARAWLEALRFNDGRASIDPNEAFESTLKVLGERSFLVA